MKTRSLTPCILLSILVILLLSTTVQATEYREVNTVVNASNISTHIENGYDIYLDNCSIIGELNASKIKLETVPNPYFKEFVNGGGSKEYIINTYGISENLSVVDRNITITDSNFENNFDFSNVILYSSADFLRTNFSSSADFAWAKFYSPANFGGAKFYSPANFLGANFNSPADFGGAKFYSPANFSMAKFNSSADFSAEFYSPSDFSGAKFYSSAAFWAKFNSPADFRGAEFYNFAFLYAKFNSSADFRWAKFYSSADFSGAKFNSSADFRWANFNSSADFWVPDTSENIKTSGKSCEFFMKSYNDFARYKDADTIYYNYRKRAILSESLTDTIINILSLVTCGFGTKLLYTLGWTWIFIIIFAIIYKNPNISCKNENKKTPIKFCWGEPGIYRKGKDEEEPVSFLEALYFSANIFTRLGSTDWQQRDSFRKWVSLEGVLGWIIFALVSATLMRLFIRP